jgi:transposase-like protein
MAASGRSGRFSQEQVKQFIADGQISSVEDIQNALKDLFGQTLQAMLEGEMDSHLGYFRRAAKADPSSDNRRNGHGLKSVRSSYGEVDIAVPRDREGDFEPLIVRKRQKNVAGIEEQILALYAKGVSTREIQDHLHQIYGIDVSPTLISNVTDKVLPQIQEWQSRPLASVYALLFLDAIHYKVRHEGRIVSKAAYMVIGVDLEGMKEVLGIWIGESESAKFWLSVLSEMKNRGVSDILLASVDNLSGFSEAIAAAFPETQIQKCLVHQVRNSIRYVSYKDVKQVTADLKRVYTAPSEAAAVAELERFDEVWGQKYPLVVASWRGNWAELSTFFAFSPEIRRLIYTTNVIESYHRQLRKVTKGKALFPGDESLLKMLCLVTCDVQRKWTVRIPHWGQILAQLSICFPERVKWQN